MYITLGTLKGGGTPGGSGGGHPIIASVTNTVETASPYGAVMPATVDAGDLLIMLLDRTDLGASPSDTPTGWTQLGTDDAIYYKWAVGTEGGTTVTFADSGSIDVIFTVLHIQNADSAQNPQAVWDTQSSTSVPNPPSLDPTWADANNLIIAYAGTIDVRSIVSYPAGYTLYQQEHDTSEGTIFIAAKQVTVSTSENPGNFTISSSSSTYVATIAVKGT